MCRLRRRRRDLEASGGVRARPWTPRRCWRQQLHPHHKSPDRTLELCHSSALSSLVPPAVHGRTWTRHSRTRARMPGSAGRTVAAADPDSRVLGSDLQNILRQSYDYLTIMPKLRSTYDGRLIYKTSYNEWKAFHR